jgi:hypothetical protein
MREELIIKYLDQSLDKNEALVFENLCATDPTIIEEINQIQQIDLAFRSAYLHTKPAPLFAVKLRQRLTSEIEVPIIDITKEESILAQIKDLIIPILSGLAALILIYLKPVETSSSLVNLINTTTSYYLLLSTLCILGLFILDRYLQKKNRSIGILMMVGF